MSLIISQYSYLFKNNNKYYIFNSENCFFSEINHHLYSVIQDRDYESLDMKTLSLLKEKRILISNEEATLYYQESKFRYELASYNKDVLKLTLVPTIITPES